MEIGGGIYETCPRFKVGLACLSWRNGSKFRKGIKYRGFCPKKSYKTLKKTDIIYGGYGIAFKSFTIKIIKFKMY